MIYPKLRLNCFNLWIEEANGDILRIVLIYRSKKPMKNYLHKLIFMSSIYKLIVLYEKKYGLKFLNVYFKF